MFLIINDTGEVSESTLWETLKAYLRGQIISYSVGANRLRTERISSLTHKILDLDRSYSVSPSPGAVFTKDLRAKSRS